MYSLDWLKRPQLFRRLLNCWPPLFGAGISIQEISPDWRYGRVKLGFGIYNRNMLGSQFGGSLFAMTDMMYVFMLLRYLGDQHIIWDQSASIEFKRPGRGPVFAEFFLAPERVEEIRARAISGEKLLEPFEVAIKDRDGGEVARVERIIYIRRKRPKSPSTGN